MKSTSTLQIKEKAIELGFAACGIAKAAPVAVEHKKRLEEWLTNGCHGKMGYMQNHFEKRTNPTLLLEGAQSVISLAINYHHPQHQPPEAGYKISQYAVGKDYHFVIKDKLSHLLEFIHTLMPEGTARIFTDSAPILERYWAQQAGLGWVGKNGCLILPKRGSYFFLAEILLDVPLDYDEPFTREHCGNCTRCLDTCPTQAITAPGRIDARRCLSYLTIELKDPIPASLRGKTQGYIFGCDICQQVCPHNQKFATPTTISEFQPLKPVATWQKKDWESLTKESFKESFVRQGSPLARVKYEKLMDNLRATLLK